MQGKIFGIPLTVIVLILSITVPVVAGEVIILKQVRNLKTAVMVAEEETRTYLMPKSVEVATPSATPTTKKVLKVWTPVITPTNIP